MFRITTAGIAEREGSFFIARRKPGNSIGGFWEFPGGKKREGETPEAALEREFKEEFNLKIAVGELLWEGEFYNKDKKYLLKAYKIFIKSGPVELKEHDEYMWAALDTLKGLEFPDSDRMLLDFLCSKRN